MIYWTPEYIYADDTRLTFASNDEENMNDDLTKITECYRQMKSLLISQRLSLYWLVQGKG